MMAERKKKTQKTTILIHSCVEMFADENMNPAPETNQNKVGMSLT